MTGVDPQRWLELDGARTELVRHPDHGTQLRAWDAADVLLLRSVELPADGPLLVVNDRHGALSVSLDRPGVTMLSDSYCSRRAVQLNLERNGRPADAVDCIGPFDTLEHAPAAVLFRPTRDLSVLERLLRGVASQLDEGTVLFGADMSRRLAPSLASLLETSIGPVHVHRAVGKARRIDATRAGFAPPSPREPSSYRLDALGLDLEAAPGVFGAARTDPGTAQLLEHLPARFDADRIVDLGCGNGVIAIAAGAVAPDAELVCVDDSELAVHACEQNLVAAFGPDRARRVVHGNGLFDWPDGRGLEDGSVDVVLSNPPFHDDHALGDATAWAMFRDARRALRRGGELWVVGNRHLAYHAKLSRLFGSCEVVASDARFVVLRAVSSRAG